MLATNTEVPLQLHFALSGHMIIDTLCGEGTGHDTAYCTPAVPICGEYAHAVLTIPARHAPPHVLHKMIYRAFYTS